MRKITFILVTTSILFLLMFVLFPALGWSTTVTGVIKQNGVPLTGYVDVSLVYPSTNGTSLNLPGPGDSHQPVYNGNFPAMNIPGNDTLLPDGTYYQVTYYDAYAQPLARSNYVITGATFDIGAAVPTPVTTSNINFLDLLGIRNFSAQNISVTNSFTVGKTVFSTLGVTGAAQVDDFRFTLGYLTGSTTCGIQEAINSLPASGGTVYLQAGSCTITSTVNMATPVRLIGMGMFSTTIVNGTTSSSPLTVTGNNAQLSDFSTLNGGITVNASDEVNISRVSIVTPQSAGVTASSATHLTISQVAVNGGAGDGVSLNGGSTLVHIEGANLTGNVGNGVTMNVGVGQVAVTDSTISSNSGSGVAVNSGDSTASLYLSRSTLTDNHIAGAFLADGRGHVVDSNIIQFGTHQQYGVYMGMPTSADAFLTQATVKDNLFGSNSVADLFSTATPSYILLYPQTEQVGGTTTTSFANPAAIHSIVPAVSNTAEICTTGSTWSCYSINGGVIAERGVAGPVPTGADTASLAISFPHTFTSTANLTFLAFADNCADVCSGKNPISVSGTGASSLTTTGNTVSTSGVVPQGGGGSVINAVVFIHWQATGH